MVEVCTRKKSYCSDECNTEQPQQESNELCLSQRAAWWNELRDSRERTFVSNRGGGLLNSLVNLSLKGCSQLHRTDVVLRKGCTTGLRVSPRGPLPLPGKVRRATSYAGSSSGSSPQRSNTTAASLCSLDAANQPQQPVPAGRAAAGTAGTAARAQSPAADASTKVSHGRSCSYSSGSSAVGGMGGDSSHGSSPPSSVGTAYEANRAASSKITLLEDPCDMRFWSVPSMPPRSFSDRTTGGQGQWKGGSGLNAGSPPPMVTERLAFGVSTAIGVRSTMEDFAFALPLAHPSGVDSELLQAACFGVFDGHGGAEVAQSLAEHVPGRIQENVHQIIEFGPQHIAEVLMGHESLLRRLTEPWIVESSQADTTSPCAPNLISPCPVVWEEEHLGRRMHAQTMGRQQQQQEQQPQYASLQEQQQQEQRKQRLQQRVQEAQELQRLVALQELDLPGPTAALLLEEAMAAAEAEEEEIEAATKRPPGGGSAGMQAESPPQHGQQQHKEEQQQQQQQQQQQDGPSPPPGLPPEFEAGDPGSTALVVTIVGDRLFCANVGDCRLLVAELDPTTNTVIPRRVTCDHNSQHPGEAARLAALSVSVSEDGYVGGQEGWLQVSRSIGDFSVKRALGEEIILSEPELHTLRLTENMLFAVAVSDGITNKLSDETIVNQVCRFLSEVPPARKEAAAAAAAAAAVEVYPEGPDSPSSVPPPRPLPLNNDPHHAASQLVQYAINAADSDDNCAVVVVSFKDTPPPVPRRPRLFQRKAATTGQTTI